MDSVVIIYETAEGDTPRIVVSAATCMKWLAESMEMRVGAALEEMIINLTEGDHVRRILSVKTEEGDE